MFFGLQGNKVEYEYVCDFSYGALLEATVNIHNTTQIQQCKLVEHGILK